MDLQKLLQDKKKKAFENNNSFQKATKTKPTGSNKMPMRKAGRGK